MYIIEFEQGVYSTEGKGDPARTLKVENAQSFSDAMSANIVLNNILDEIKVWRKFPNACVKWRDEINLNISNISYEDEL